jgi:hypothetical protein
MTNVLAAPLAFEAPSASAPAAAAAWDTTAASAIHAAFARLDRSQRADTGALFTLYLASVGVTFVPLLLAALSSPLALTMPTASVRLPFLYDCNVLFMFLVSFPCLAILTVTDQHVLARALDKVQVEGTITIAASDVEALASRWRRLFRTINLASQALGIVVGSIVTYFNYVTYTPAAVGFWIAQDGRLLAVGYVFLYCILVFYTLIPIYVVRNIAISLLLRDVVRHSELHLLPLHPDKAGGLRPVGHLGLRNQYALTLIGLNVVALVAVSVVYLAVPLPLYGLMVAAVLAYIVLGPIVFVAPLLPFREGMLKTKSVLMCEVALRMRVELTRVRQQLATGPISKDDEELVERLRKISAIINELPVWPFDASTLRKFLTAYVIPIATSVGYPVAKFAWELMKDRLHM